MAEEPLEVEVLDKDGQPLVKAEPRKLSLLNPINALALVFAVLTAMMIFLMALASVLIQQAEKLDEEDPEPDKE